ncbi:MAG: hypothetical protein H7Y42_17335 [Chitinophagaceae bacterium]|nr:hypothetical protein [Chitinophagaceae bacterium]
MTGQGSAIETIIKDYIESKDRSHRCTRKRNDQEKEYNKLLTIYSGEVKNYTLEQADKIYLAYQDMIISGEEASLAESNFLEAEKKLNELGAILFDATINAEIDLIDGHGTASIRKPVTVAYFNGQVVVS